jgi:hypothetical protein
VGRYWRAVLVVFFNHGVDTGTAWKSAPFPRLLAPDDRIVGEPDGRRGRWSGVERRVT